jgi:hypothetical protein
MERSAYTSSGFEGISANAVRDLLAEEKSLANGKPPSLGLGADTIRALLALDPLIPGNGPVAGAGLHTGPPVIGPPRFVPANPPEHSGTGTSAMGDSVSVSFDSATDDKQTTTISQTTITDTKPGWLSVVLGADNVDTTTTATFTNSQSTDDKVDDKITSTVTFFSTGLDDPFDVKIFKDVTFETYAIVDSDSPLLQGGPSVNAP